MQLLPSNSYLLTLILMGKPDNLKIHEMSTDHQPFVTYARIMCSTDLTQWAAEIDLIFKIHTSAVCL